MENETDPFAEDGFEQDWKEMIKLYRDSVGQDPEGLELEPDDLVVKKFLFYSENGEYKRVKIKEIAYLEGDDNYVRIYFLNSKYVLVRGSITKILCELPHKRFIKISRSHWVVAKHVKAWTKEYVKINQVELPVMKSCLPELKFRFIILGTF